jgi:hypothetical protein
MAADLPVIEVLDVLLVEEDFQVAPEAAAEISFEFLVQSSDESGHGFT